VALDPEHLLRLAGLELGGITDWNSDIPSKSSGVYVITTEETRVVISALDSERQARWITGQEIVYIGRASHLSRRLRQFRSHRYGADSPHRGGQDILLLGGSLTIHWAEAEEYKEAEAKLISLFAKHHDGKLPFGNRQRPGVHANSWQEDAAEMTLAERVVAKAGVCGGRARIAGTRIRVVDIVAALCAGDDIEEILRDFPYLVRDDIDAAIAYAVAELERPVVTSATTH
jgi:uncharacterized protein (DUF433 family)